MIKNILVTGAGALLGQGILRCLNLSNNCYKIISADPDVRSTGHALSNKSYVIPLITDNGYLERIEEIISSEKIDAILIGTDVELPLFAMKKHYLEQKYGLKVVVSQPSVIEISNNKWLTSEFLRKSGFDFPISALTIDADAINRLKVNSKYPLIAKPVDGARSKGIEIIESESDLNRVCSYKNNLVVQEMLSEEEGEYTTGCLVIDGKCKAVVSLIRDLRDGNTWRAYRNDATSNYDDTIAMIAEKLGVEGPANFQYRIKNGKPVVFEINCRFSGTTPLRFIFGFNEVEGLLDYYLEDKQLIQPKLRTGTVLRTFSDLYIGNDTLKDFKREKVSSSFVTEYYPFKRQR